MRISHIITLHTTLDIGLLVVMEISAHINLIVAS